jgi:glycosyl transferase family 2
MNLNIITPVSRPENLPTIASSVFDPLPRDIQLTWWLILDTVKLPLQFNYPKTKVLQCDSRGRSITGNIQRNYGLSAIRLQESTTFNPDKSYVVFLDDDTIMHPDYYGILIETLDNKYSHAMVGNSQRADGATTLFGRPENMRVGRVDTGMITLPFAMVKDNRWDPMDYCADGAFIKQVYVSNKDKFKFPDKVTSFYNYLRPESYS